MLSARLYRLAESIPGILKRLQIRALCSEGKSDGLPVCSTTATQLLHLSSDPYLLLQAEPIFYILYIKERRNVERDVITFNMLPSKTSILHEITYFYLSFDQKVNTFKG